jgi:hypothetical protein
LVAVAVTVSAAFAVIPLTDAVIVAEPAATLVATPVVEATVATPVALEVQFAEAVRSCVLASE